MVDTVGVLLDTEDRAEQIRDQIAVILRANFDEQVQLAEDEDKSPEDYDAHVFVERLNPWESVREGDQTPVVNISVQDSQFSGQNSSAVNDQKTTTRYYIDCIAFAESRETEDGHEPGDLLASLEAQRVLRQVRQILMGPQNYVLQLRGTVHKRWSERTQILQPPAGERSVIHVVAARLVLAVDHIERSPSIEGEPLEIVHATFERKSDGEVLLEAQYDYSEE